MKVRKKEVKQCTMPDWTETTVLELIYTHKSKKFQKILVKDYDDKYYECVLKQVRKAVTEQYNLINNKWQ